jgi:DNA-binding HxlR family transcriptional regulator
MRSVPTRTYAQFCPVARTLDVLGERWTLLIVRDLMVGPQRFTDLREHLPGLAPALLTQRLRDLEAADLVARNELPPPAARTVYELTEHGRALEPVIYEIARFGLRYLDMPTADEPAPPHLLPLGVKSLVAIDALPRRPFVVHLALDEGDYTVRIGPNGGRAIERVSVEPGAPARADTVVQSSLATLLWVRQGELTSDDAHTQGLLEIEGNESIARAIFALD